MCLVVIMTSGKRGTAKRIVIALPLYVPLSHFACSCTQHVQVSEMACIEEFFEFCYVCMFLAAAFCTSASMWVCICPHSMLVAMTIYRIIVAHDKGNGPKLNKLCKKNHSCQYTHILTLCKTLACLCC